MVRIASVLVALIGVGSILTGMLSDGPFLTRNGTMSRPIVLLLGFCILYVAFVFCRADRESSISSLENLPAKQGRSRADKLPKAAEQGATDNPDDAQRVREDH